MLQYVIVWRKNILSTYIFKLLSFVHFCLKNYDVWTFNITETSELSKSYLSDKQQLFAVLYHILFIWTMSWIVWRTWFRLLEPIPKVRSTRNQGIWNAESHSLTAMHSKRNWKFVLWSWTIMNLSILRTMSVMTLIRGCIGNWFALRS